MQGIESGKNLVSVAQGRLYAQHEEVQKTALYALLDECCPARFLRSRDSLHNPSTTTTSTRDDEAPTNKDKSAVSDQPRVHHERSKKAKRTSPTSSDMMITDYISNFDVVDGGEHAIDGDDGRAVGGSG